MKQTRLIMGMPINIEIVDEYIDEHVFTTVFDYFRYVDSKYSPYKPDSEVSRINRGLPESQWSEEMRQIIVLCEETKAETAGYFDIRRKEKLDPSGLVKGWAIQNASHLLTEQGYQNFYIDAGGDIQVGGINGAGEPWQVGIRNPFNRDEIVKVLSVTSKGVATSGAYIRGEHIYNPHNPAKRLDEMASVTVVGPNIYEADRFATAAYAMGASGVKFIESLEGFEAYAIDYSGIATMTSSFERYVPAHVQAH